MKTKEDLFSIIPDILIRFREDDPNIGHAGWEMDEDGWGRSEIYETNTFCYEEDGWYIVIEYSCCGEYENDPGDYWNPPCYDLIRGWGEITDITACHCDDDTDELTEFSRNDLSPLYEALNEELAYIV